MNAMIGTPIGFRPTTQYMASSLSAFAHFSAKGRNLHFNWKHQCSNLAKARNDIVDQFLKSDFDNLIWVDDDIGYRPEYLDYLLESDEPIVGGAYRNRRTHPSGTMWEFSVVANEPLSVGKNGLIEVDFMGMGFCKMRRSVFEKMETPYFQFTEHGEDLLFFKEWRRRSGKKVFIDGRIKLAHIGEYSYEGDVMSLIGSTKFEKVGQ